jgi:hypothetical protein
MRFRIALSQRGAFLLLVDNKNYGAIFLERAKETNETISVKTTGSSNCVCGFWAEDFSLKEKII